LVETPRPSNLRSVLIEDPDELESWVEPWDGLAEEAGRPYCSPAWMLPWWYHEAPRDALLRAIVLMDDSSALVAIAPFVADRAYGALTRYRLLASGRGTPIEPLARRGREVEVARLILQQLGDVTPRPDLVTIEGATLGWTDLIGRAWGRRRRSSFRLWRSASAPCISLSGRTFEDWFAARSANFRKETRWSERRLEGHGFSTHVATGPEEVGRGLVALSTQHLDRWKKRGGSRVWRTSTLAMLREVEQRLRSTDRFRLVTIDNGLDIVGVQLSVAAGRHLSYWLGSFDERWANYHPATTAAVTSLRDAWQRGYDTVDLGQGLHPYKLRLADGSQELAWMMLIPGGLSGIRTHLRLAPRRGARAVVGRLPTQVRRRARAQLPRPPGSDGVSPDPREVSG
jgi:CelD/BcsL family acetyltransferase involved in cellulose biosynthesis